MRITSANRSVYGLAVSAAAYAGLVAHPAHAQADPPRFVRAVAELSGDDLATLRDGAPLVRTIGGGDERELTQAYVVRVRAPVALILDQIRGRHLLLDDADGPGTRGVFAEAPGVDDLAGLDFATGKIRDLERCRPGRCDVKLPMGATERMHASVDFDADSVSEAANRYLHGMLLETLATYGREGASGLAYEDKEEPLEVGAGFERLLEGADDLRELDGRFHEHLRRFPEAGATGVEDLFSWTVEDLGLKSLVSLNHVAILEPAAAGRTALVGVKRFYSSHYFQAALRVIAITPAGGDPSAPDSWVTVVARYRFDGELGGIKRVATERRLERNAERSMAEVRDRLEELYRR